MDEHNIPKLLAIDDQPKVLNSLKKPLRDCGLEILTATGAEDGLEFLRRARPRIVLLDLMMPGVRGADMLASILASIRVRK